MWLIFCVLSECPKLSIKDGSKDEMDSKTCIALEDKQPAVRNKLRSDNFLLNLGILAEGGATLKPLFSPMLEETHQTEHSFWHTSNTFIKEL